jgi:hypothetical protein
MPGRKKTPTQSGKEYGFSYCSLPQMPERIFSPDVHSARLELILTWAKKWVNGTILHYYFFDRETDGENVTFSDGTTQWESWVGNPAELAVVRQAFDVWKNVPIGLEFKEVTSREEAEARIGFMRYDGSWSYIGRDILEQAVDARTMNIGWSVTGPGGVDTPVHEIGHTLGFPHEHQNPNAGIVWDEEAVYAALAQPPNRWPREKTYYNIIRKISPDTVQGSSWDPNSIMHYPFEAGLIREPEEYKDGLTPAPGLSERDKTWVKEFYPQLPPEEPPELKPFASVQLGIGAGEQKDFTMRPSETRYYEIRTFGESDTVMVLFEEDGGELRYRTGDDDSGEDRNASLHVKLFREHTYVLRIRLYYADRPGQTTVMMW